MGFKFTNNGTFVLFVVFEIYGIDISTSTNNQNTFLKISFPVVDAFIGFSQFRLSTQEHKPNFLQIVHNVVYKRFINTHFYRLKRLIADYFVQYN